MELATHRDIRRMTGLTNRKIQYLASAYGIEAEPGTGEGRGTVRRYSEAATFDFLLAGKLADLGVKPHTIRIILDAVHSMINIKKPAIFKPGLAFLIIYERESGRYIKPELELRSDKDMKLELKHMANYESCMVIDLGTLASRMVF